MNDPTLSTSIKKFNDPLFTNVDRSTMMTISSPTSKPEMLNKKSVRPSIASLVQTKGKATFTRRAQSIINQDKVKVKTSVSFGV